MTRRTKQPADLDSGYVNQRRLGNTPVAVGDITGGSGGEDGDANGCGGTDDTVAGSNGVIGLADAGSTLSDGNVVIARCEF